MVDFDTIDKYVAAVKRGGVAIQMKQIHNLDRFIEQVVYDFAPAPIRELVFCA